MKKVSSFLNVLYLNAVLNCSGRGQFVCSSYTGTQSGIFRVLKDISYISLCNCKTADTLSLLVSSFSTIFSVGYGHVFFFTFQWTTWDPENLVTKMICPHFTRISITLTLWSQIYLFLVFILWSYKVFSVDMFILVQRIWVFPYIAFRDIIGFSS